MGDALRPSENAWTCRVRSVRQALRSSDWGERLAAIESVKHAGDVRFRSRLRMLARFHLAPPEVRTAAARAAEYLEGLFEERRGWLSMIGPPGLAGHVSMLVSHRTLPLPHEHAEGPPETDRVSAAGRRSPRAPSWSQRQPDEVRTPRRLRPPAGVRGFWG